MPALRAIGAVLAAVLLAPAVSAASVAPPAALLDVRELTAPAALTGLAPGDTTEWAAEVTNVGSSAHQVSVAFAVDGGDALATDPRAGLQLDVDLCPSAFTIDDVLVADGRSVERYLCPEGVEPMGTGPAASLGRLDGSRALDRGETVGVRVRVSFPAGSGNALESTSAALRVLVRETGAIDDSGAPGGGPSGNGADDEGASGNGALGNGGPGNGLAVTGRDVGAALLGGLLALGAGLLLAATGRRRKEARS
ncbi:sortase [Rathayibacter sp. VKM Ac-2927]|uniref:sortase n=1 Tax=Rathayibacter sp. VKM Ac-2927 TaxID=2929478 RepID=UPI001FB22796|nr:sortase [Rathayibacter sp. VKM Ac-2927]MCJ1687940.1 sortase [Rathayibacter sp. VKM Ac-2927]